MGAALEDGGVVGGGDVVGVGVVGDGIGGGDVGVGGGGVGGGWDEGGVNNDADENDDDEVLSKLERMVKARELERLDAQAAHDRAWDRLELADNRQSEAERLHEEALQRAIMRGTEQLRRLEQQQGAIKARMAVYEIKRFG